MIRQVLNWARFGESVADARQESIEPKCVEKQAHSNFARSWIGDVANEEVGIGNKALGR